MSENVPLSEIVPDDRNANKGTQRGLGQIEQSIRRFGFLEAGTLDKNNKIIGGNKRTEVSAHVLDADEALVVDVDGTRPVYIRRKDLDLDSKQGREAAIALNRTAQVSIEFDPGILAELLDEGVKLDDWFNGDELAGLLEQAGTELTGIVDAPEQFKEYDESIQTEHCCPKCGYEWSGKSGKA